MRLLMYSDDRLHVRMCVFSHVVCVYVCVNVCLWLRAGVCICVLMVARWCACVRVQAPGGGAPSHAVARGVHGSGSPSFPELNREQGSNYTARTSSHSPIENISKCL